MSDEPVDDRYAALRRGVYQLVIVASLASVIGRILVVQSADRTTPFLSANDRSRWCTIRALVDHGTYAIDEVIQDKGWDTIDKVRHRGRDGQLHFYSSKPTLLSTLLAAEYWIIHALTGTTLTAHPFYVGRLMLVVTNALPLALYFCLLARMVERYGSSDWGRIFVMVVAAFGTFLTAFAVTLSNHLPAAICVLIALNAAMRIWYDGKRGWHLFAIAGLFAALAAALELPAMALLAMLGCGLVCRAPQRTLLGFAPAALVVAAGFFGTNYQAHATWQPPYAQRHVEGGWYDFEGSYWFGDNRKGVDRGEPSRGRYALHAICGHHGIFALTPVWLMSAVGLVVMLRPRQSQLFALAFVILVVSVACLVFYIALRPADDRNYGGVAIGFRWLFWLTPLWLLAMLPAADWMAAGRWWRAVALVLLAVSVCSASYSPLNPWSHPWLYAYWIALGWVGS